jgi:hypothetical protein
VQSRAPVFVLALLAACSSEVDPCSPANCAGCCFNGGCFVGTLDELCGAGGVACSACEEGFACEQRMCVADRGVNQGGVVEHADASVPDARPFVEDAGDPPPPPDAGAVDPGEKDAGASDPGGLVTGVRVFRFITDDGELALPSDISRTTIRAIVDRNGVTTEYAGLGRADGTFEIPGVPPGPFMLRFRNFWVATSAQHLVLDQVALGRPDAVAATLPMTITFNADNLEPWVPDSYMAIFCSNSGASSLLIFNTSPPADETAFGFTTDYSLITRPLLLDASRGDVLTIAQMVHQPTPYPHSVAKRGAVVSGVTLEDGVDATIDATFTELPLDDVALDWRTTEFEALTSAVHPTAVFARHRLSFEPVPAGLSRGRYGDGPRVAFIERAPGAGNLTMNLRYGNPYAGTAIAPAYLAEMTFDYQLAGATPRTISAFIRQGGPLNAIDGVPLRPLLSPPSMLRINGQPATTERTGVGVRPTISWSPPAIGVPDGYLVSIYELSIVDGATMETLLATIRTRETSVTVPPTILSAGHSYFFVVAAAVNGGIDYQTTPFLRGYPDRVAPAYTRIVTP